MEATGRDSQTSLFPVTRSTSPKLLLHGRGFNRFPSTQHLPIMSPLTVPVWLLDPPQPWFQVSSRRLARGLTSLEPRLYLQTPPEGPFSIWSLQSVLLDIENLIIKRHPDQMTEALQLLMWRRIRSNPSSSSSLSWLNLTTPQKKLISVTYLVLLVTSHRTWACVRGLEHRWTSKLRPSLFGLTLPFRSDTLITANKVLTVLPLRQVESFCNFSVRYRLNRPGTSL